MLGKLLKYELKSTSRVLWILYAAVIALGLVIGIALHFMVGGGTADAAGGLSYSIVSLGLPEIMLSIFLILYVLLIAAMGIMTIIFIILRFNSNLLRGEGYLMHTLPVPTWMLVLSKLIVAFLWSAIGCVCAIVSAFLLSLTSGMYGYLVKQEGVDFLLKMIREVFGPDAGWFIAAAIVSTIALILQFYFSLAIGNLANRYKILIAVAAFIGIQIVLALITSIVGSSGFVSKVMDLRFSSLLIREIIINLITGAAFYFGTTLILKKRLNLA